MIPKRVLRSKVFGEFTQDFSKHWFDLKEKNVVANYDNVYYTVALNEDACSSEIDSFISDLRKLREAFDFKAEVNPDFMGLDYFPFGMKFYNNKLSKPECFDILICESLPNEKTPRILVQIRARFLWLYGFESAFRNSIDILKEVLLHYDIDILNVMENRIDYAFHTNCIQNVERYFDRSNLAISCVTNARIYNHVGDPNRDWSIDYLSVGSRSAKSVFFRAYNKSREVVEMNYKSFFLQLWKDKELISEYDKYVLETAYELHSFDVGILIGRIHWYLEYGTDDVLKKELEKLKKSCYADSSNSSVIRKRLKGLLPDITTICNIEYETHRDFYRSFDKSLLDLPGGLTEVDTLSTRLFQIHDCRKAFVNYLTSYDGSVAFVDDVNEVRQYIKELHKRLTRTKQLEQYHSLRKQYLDDHYSDFWKRIRAADIGTEFTPDIYRSYERKVDVEKVKRRICTDVALLSIHRNGVNEVFDMNDDISDFYSLLNDNDMQCLGAVDSNGELINIKYGDYYTVKQRKNRQYRSILSPAKEKN